MRSMLHFVEGRDGERARPAADDRIGASLKATVVRGGELGSILLTPRELPS